jgi:hypothetical protein
MGVPQANDRVKEAPAHALRAVFAGIGRLLSVTDKLRNRPAPAAPAADAESVAPETVAPETVTPETVAPETVTPETVAPEAEPEAAVPGGGHVKLLSADAATEAEAAPAPAADAATGAEAEAASATEAEAAPAPAPAAEAAPAAELPVPNYDDLSIASLRARLRSLSADQLSQLIEYEKGHAARADVISMFERRLVKLAES